jgi:hypothetical protein
MGNETSPLDIICQVNISSTNWHPAIALVIPDLGVNGFKDIRGGDSNDIYRIIYTRPDRYPQTNDGTTRYLFQIYPKVTMNRTMIRCGVAFSQGTTGACWGEHVILVHYVNSLMPPPPWPTSTTQTCTTSDTTTTTTSDAPTQTTGSNTVVYSEEPFSQRKATLDISLGTVIPIVVIIGVGIPLGILAYKLLTRKKQVHVTSKSQSMHGSIDNITQN